MIIIIDHVKSQTYPLLIVIKKLVQPILQVNDIVLPHSSIKSGSFFGICYDTIERF